MRVFSVFLLFFLVSILSLTSFFLKILVDSYTVRVGKAFVESNDLDQEDDELLVNVHQDNDNEAIQEESKCKAVLVAPSPTPSSPSSTTSSSTMVALLQHSLSRQSKRVRSWHRRRVLHIHNRYELPLKQPSSSQCSPLVAKKSASTLLCELNNAVKHIDTFLRDDEFFGQLQLSHLLPSSALFSDRVFNSCAVVSSAGSLLHSGLGSFIDDHDVVIRFNDAPVDDFGFDVGYKTTLRIVNSKVVADPRFQFLSSSLFSSVDLLVWDPSHYRSPLSSWYSSPDQHFFENFFSLSLMLSQNRLHLLKPQVMWQLWHYLQSQFSTCPLLPNPPSSGFLGFALALKHCHTVSLVHFVSTDISRRCHYYEEAINEACTTGEWHPIAAEKLVALAMSHQANVHLRKDVNGLKEDDEGVLEIRGLPDLKCSD